MTSEVTQSCPTLCDPMDCSLLGSSVHGIFQARVLDWVAISFSRGPSWPRDRTPVSRTVGRRFTVWATRERLMTSGCPQFKNCLAILISLQFSRINEKTTHIYSIINFIITHSYGSQMIWNICFQQQKEKKTKPNQRQYRKKKKRKKEAIQEMQAR